MGIYLDKPPPPSPTVASFQHLVVRRHRPLFLACCLLLVITSLYTIFTVSASSSGVAPTELRPVHLRKGPDGRVRSLIPQKIWQIMLPKGDKTVDLYNVDPDQLKETNTWLAKNIDYQYQLLGPRRADEFVETHFAKNQRLLNAYHNLTNLGMKSDLLRYLLLSVEGGVYSDIDTVAIRPVDAWIPRYLRNRIRLVVGIEFDKRDGPNWADIPHDLQFCQWTIAAAPGHPVFTRMVDGILDSLDELSEKHGVPVSDIKPGSFEVMNSTGPAAWTDAVFETLQGFDPSLNETKDLAFMEKARVIGDVLVLTINGFGMGQDHSASTNDGTIPPEALIKHQFWGSWREPTPPSEEEQEEAEEGNAAGDSLIEQQKAEGQRLAEEAQRMQEAQRLEEEAEKLKKGAEALAEEAQRQKAEAMKTLGEAHQHQHNETSAAVEVSPSDPKLPAPSPVQASSVHESSAGSDLENSGDDHEHDHEHDHDHDHDHDHEVLAIDTSPPPVVPSENSRDDDYDPDEVLAVDTGSPPWPGQEWAP